MGTFMQATAPAQSSPGGALDTCKCSSIASADFVQNGFS